VKFDLNGLEAIEAVVRYGGFARAAEHLHKVQSAVSHQVRKLEQQLGVRVFNRDGYRVRLTPAGEVILAEGRRLLAQVEHVRSIARQFSQEWEPSLAIIVDGILPLEPTLAAMKTLAAAHVPTRIQVKVEFLRGVQSRFEIENGDLMLVTDYAASPYLHEEALPAMDCVLCAGRSHALAKAKHVSLAQLQDQVELSVQHSSEEQGYDRHLFGCERAFFLSSHNTKKEALLMGVGFGWMPLYLVHNELKSGALREVKYQGGSWYRFTPRLVHRADRRLGRAGEQFISLLRKAAWPRPRLLRSGA
jgi:DNA-binding transcriptional LysR family regulator